MREIPAGRVQTYVDLCPGAPWRVGRVVRLEQPGGIPWWRAVKADGSLGGGEHQRDLLVREGVGFRPGTRARVDLARHRSE
ncbi:MGMT family protein [Paraconexibacter antarcticus]|uniref:MGMT family protein n=2 Tax=Paraconexibacter antarcticus TaxID=2949664 RepID=A0ABY5DYJ1_9ACTN|nr:MGMT family protein [Paraconexibacter antarcticus]UTI67101.1 MGMT family protein [Paraconexibacter antarcticus]